MDNFSNSKIFPINSHPTQQFQGRTASVNVRNDAEIRPVTNPGYQSNTSRNGRYNHNNQFGYSQPRREYTSRYPSREPRPYHASQPGPIPQSDYYREKPQPDPNFRQTFVRNSQTIKESYLAVVGQTLYGWMKGNKQEQVQSFMHLMSSVDYALNSIPRYKTTVPVYFNRCDPDVRELLKNTVPFLSIPSYITYKIIEDAPYSYVDESGQTVEGTKNLILFRYKDVDHHE